MIDNDKKKIENNYLLNSMYKFVLFVENEIIEISKKKSIGLFYFIKKIDIFFESIKINYILANFLYIIYLFFSLVNKDYIFIIYSILIYIIFYLIFKKNAVIYVYIFIIANLFFELFLKKSDNAKNIIENFRLKSSTGFFEGPKKEKKKLSEAEKDKILEGDDEIGKENEKKGEEYEDTSVKIEKKNAEKNFEKQFDQEKDDDTAKKFGEEKDEAENIISNSYKNSALNKKNRIF
jgi:hypothetical protein